MPSHHRVLVAVLFLGLVLGCAMPEETDHIPFKKPSSYRNARKVGVDIVAGAEVYYNRKETRKAFGFDIRKAGIVPIFIVVQNKKPSPLKVLPKQTFLKGKSGVLWNVPNSRDVYRTLLEYNRAGGDFSVNYDESATNQLEGFAVGMITDESVIGKARKSETKETAAGKTRKRLTEELRNGNLENREIQPNSHALGILYFSGKIQDPVQLHLTLEVVHTGVEHELVLPFEGRYN